MSKEVDDLIEQAYKTAGVIEVYSIFFKSKSWLKQGREAADIADMLREHARAAENAK